MNPIKSEISTVKERERMLSTMVLSTSGWRYCFAPDTDSETKSINPVQRDIVVLGTTVFVEFLRRKSGSDRPTVVVGTDTRPTGPAIADTVIRTFCASRFSVIWLGQVAAPQIMAYTKITPGIDGFFYVTASHNPVGYNGLKFGLGDGAVLPGHDALPLIDTFRQKNLDQRYMERLVRDVEDVAGATLEPVYSRLFRNQTAAAQVYERFVLRIAAGSVDETNMDNEFVAPIRRILHERPLGVVGDLNGSARCGSIDRHLLPRLGVRCAFFNDRAGEFAHQLLPEGAGLNQAARLLAEYHRNDSAFQLAYVPDTDGDRGNLIFIDAEGQAVVLEAQQVFAMVVLVELAWARKRGISSDQMCIVANGPTSARVDALAEQFGVRVFRAEVGEANVVSLAQELREQGWFVPVLGEGSNGGNITPPATVRDPMSTVTAMLKLHCFSLQDVLYATEPGREVLLSDVAGMLPRFSTIETDDERAKMHVGSVAHADLKASYEALLPERVPEISEALGGHFTIADWSIWNYEGTRTTEGPGNRTGQETGGLRVCFSDPEKQTCASVWMRGSGTEPVFRVLADCRGDNEEALDHLIQWQRRLVTDALEAAQRESIS